MNTTVIFSIIAVLLWISIGIIVFRFLSDPVSHRRDPKVISSVELLICILIGPAVLIIGELMRHFEYIRYKLKR